MIPKDQRDELWLDPRVLYRLHDQTVEIFAEISSEPDHVVEPFESLEDGVIDHPEGFFQAKGKDIIGAKVEVKTKPVSGVEHCFELTRTLVPVRKND